MRQITTSARTREDLPLFLSLSPGCKQTAQGGVQTNGSRGSAKAQEGVQGFKGECNTQNGSRGECSRESKNRRLKGKRLKGECKS
jgi:hypothetical protein